MSRCQHNERIVKFCIAPNCTHPHAGGCEYCFKRYHCHLGEAKFLKETQVNQMIKELTLFEDKKVKIRPLKEAIYNYFNVVKGQLSTYIDCLSSNLLNRITYPYIQKEGYLNVFKKLKHKEYNKLNTGEMIRFKEFKANNPQEKLQNKEMLAYFDQSQDVYKKVMTINNLYKQFQKEAQDSYFGESIMSVSIYCKKIQEIYEHIENQKTTFLKKFEQILGQNAVPSLKDKIKTSEKQKDIPERISQVSFVYDSQKKHQATLPTKSPFQVDSTQEQVQKQNSQPRKRQIRPRKISIDSRCSDPLVRSRAKTFEEKEKQIVERKQRLEQMMNKKQRKERISVSSQGSNQFQLRERQNIDSSQNGKEITESEMKYVRTKEEVEMGAHTLLPEGKDERKLYQQLQAIEKKTLKIPVNVIHENEQQECQSPIMKLKKNEKPKSAHGSSGFQLGLFKVQPTEQKTQSQHDEARSEPIQKPDQIQSKSSSQTSSDKENVKPAPSEAIDMNISEREANSIFLLAESLNLSAKKAIPILEGALKYAPHNFSAAEYLSFLYLQQNKPKECLKTCNQALKLISGEPNAVEISVHLHNNKAAAFNLLGRFSESIPILQKCIEVKKKDIFFKNLGDAYFNLGIIEKAIINYENALILNDDNHEALYNLGVCLYFQKNYESSKLKVQKALMLDHENQNYIELYKQIGVAIQQERNR